MTLSATGPKTFQSQTLLDIVKSAKAQNKLPQGEDLKLSGPTVSFEDLKKQCEGHPELEALVQDFIDHPDKYEKGQSTAKHESPAKSVSFGGQQTPAKYEVPDAVKAIMAKAAGQPLEAGSIAMPQSTLSFNIVPPGMQRISEMEEQYRSISASRQNADNTPDENKKYDAELELIRTQILSLSESTESTYRSNLVEGLSSLESQQTLNQKNLAQFESKLAQAKPEEVANLKRDIALTKQNLEHLDKEIASHKQTATAVLTRLQAVKLKYQTNLSTWGEGNKYETKTTQFARSLATQAGSVAELYTKSQGADSTGMPNVDLKLNQGNNFIYANLILTESPETLNKFENLLKRSQSNLLTSVTPQEKQLLKDMGIHFNGGKLYNIMNSSQAPLSDSAISQLIQSASSLRTASGTGQEVDGITLIRRSLSAALKDSQALQAARESLDTAISGLDESIKKHDDAQQVLDQKKTQLNQSSQQLDETRKLAEEIGKVLNEGGPEGLLNYVAGLDAGKLAQVNKLFGGSQLRIELGPDQQLKFFVDSKPTPDARDFWKRFEQAARQLPKAVSDQEAQVARDETAVETQAQVVQDTGKEVKAQQAKVRIASQAHATAAKKAEESTQTAADQVQKQGAALPPALTAAIDGILQETKSKTAKQRSDLPDLNDRIAKTNQRAETSLETGRKKISEAQEAVTVSRPKRQRLKKMMLLWQSMLPRLGEQIEKLMKLPVQTPVQKLAEDALRKLIDKADELENDYNRALAPVPNNEKLYEFTDKLRLLVEESQAQFETMRANQQEKDGVQKKIAGDHFTKQIEQGAYHAKRLKEISASRRNLSPADIQDLSAALKHIKGSLFMNQSLQAQLAS